MINLEALSLLSNHLWGFKEYITLTILAVVLGIIFYAIYAIFSYPIKERNRRRTEHWIIVMEAQSDEQLKKDLDKLESDSMLPYSYMGVQANTLKERYLMVEDFMRICKKRGI